MAARNEHSSAGSSGLRWDPSEWPTFLHLDIFDDEWECFGWESMTFRNCKRDTGIARATSDHSRHGRAAQDPVRPVPCCARKERRLPRWLRSVSRFRLHIVGDSMGKK